MRQNDPFFLVEDSLNETLDSLEHSDELMHFSFFKSKSKYKGGFKKGKNTKEYNHDYYIHNKDKWKKNGVTEDELKELGFTDEEIAMLEFEKDANGHYNIPVGWWSSFFNGMSDIVTGFIDSIKDTFLSLIGKKDEKDDVIEPQGPKSPFLEAPKTLEDPQAPPLYETELEDQTGRTEKMDLTFDHADYYEDFAIKDKPASVLEDCAAINPHFPLDSDGNPTAEMSEIIENITSPEDREAAEEFIAGYTQNCAWCSYAYDLRRRGYDVQAPCDSEGLFNSDIVQFYENTTLDDFKIPEYVSDNRMSSSYMLFHELAEQGDGARGIITVTWDDGTGEGTGGGHAMAWEVVGGQAYIIDPQSNTVMDKKQFYERDGYRILWNYNELINNYYNVKPEQQKEFAGVAYLRTDDKELNTSGTISHVTVVPDYFNNVHIDDTGEVVNLGDHMVSNEPSEASKETWAKLKKYKKVKKKGKKKRKRDVY